MTSASSASRRAGLTSPPRLSVQPLLAPDATYSDTRTSSTGHNSCAVPGVRWLEGLVPLSPAFPLRPNEREMMNSEKVIYGALGR